MEDMSKRFSLVLECSGAHAARNRGLHIVKPHGIVVLLGENDAPWTIEETKPIRRKDFMMMRSFYFPKSDFEKNIDLLRRHRAQWTTYFHLKRYPRCLRNLPAAIWLSL
jgi:threonine dehydrogenase-like Zn-dependent dehydrogenase